MEGIFQSGIPMAQPENLGCARRSANATLDDCTPWTNEKHNLYLNHLEMSFVKQLHQSMGLLVQCSKQNEINKNISQKHPANDNTASQQVESTVLGYGYCQKIDNEREKSFSHSYADSHEPLMSPWINNFRHVRTHCWLLSADMQKFLKLHCIKKHRNGKWIVSRGLATCSEKFSASKPYECDLIDSMREGMGQNFVNEDNSSRSNCKSQAKRLKTAVADSSGYDQIIPSRKCRKTDNSAISNRYTPSGEELSRHGCVSEIPETFVSLPI